MDTIGRYVREAMTALLDALFGRKPVAAPLFRSRKEAFARINAMYKKNGGVNSNWKAAIERRKARAAKRPVEDAA